MKNKVNPIDAFNKLDHQFDVFKKSNNIPADNDRAGKMTPQHYQKLMIALGNRKKLDAGTDIFKLSPGHYYGNGLINSTWPSGNDGVTLIDVEEIPGGGFKQIREIESVSGTVYYYTTHTNEAGVNHDAPIGWTTQERRALLWQGDVSAVGSKITLTDRYSKYKKIGITVDDQNGHREVHDVTLNNGVGIVNTTNNYNDSVIVASYEIELGFKDNGCTINRNTLYVVAGGGTNNISTDKDILSVIKIEGIM